MSEFTLKNCKTLARAAEVRVTKTTDALHDAFCKVAAVMLEDSALARELLRDAQAFVEECRVAGRPWKLRDIRDLQRRRREEADFREEVCESSETMDATPARWTPRDRCGAGPASRPRRS